jgi:hypothetical protein
MAVNDGLPVVPPAMPGDALHPVQPARAARRRSTVLKAVVLMSVARVATDKRTLVAVIVAVVGLAAAKQLASEGGNPVDWYLSLSRDKPDAAP